MTQRVALGITVGASNSVAVAAAGDERDSVRTRPSVLRLSPDAPPALGAAAHGSAPHAREVLLEGFLARVGDPVDMLAEDGSSHSAADLVATAVNCLMNEADAEARSTVACHPAWWSAHTVEIQRTALARAGLDELTLVPEPLAALRWLTATHGPRADGAVVVYDLGATGLTVSVLRTGDHAGLLGTPARSTDIAGAEFDLRTMRYVLANVTDANDLDPFDPAVERELATLRDRCRTAKEELSINTATVVRVRLNPADAHSTNVRLVRGELEELLRAPLLASTELIRDAVHRAGLDIGDLDGVLLTGGGSAIPLVAELISSEFGLPVLAAPAPAQTSAHGAALLAADRTAAGAAPASAPEDLPTVALSTTPAVAPALSGAPALPTAVPARRGGRRRMAVVAGAVVVLGLLATGTVAIGTGIQSNPGTTAPSTPARAGEVAATFGPAPDAPRDPNTPVAVVDSAPPSATHAKAEAGQPAIPPAAAVAVVDSRPAAEQPPAPPAEPGAAQPAPPAPPQPGPAPAPAPAPAPQQPPPAPAVPNLPAEVLNDTVDEVGGAVGTILRAPGKILGGNGG
ncbi:Hsp70 family protein [Nocardia brasiliensis]|uniref:Hsp70 family protein n=1 Tax=Nocardia brasiliensis TaxID=37326 RepID=A0A6G9Y0G0_NOCBR|nr:Hsp70 family protein [Nocardia brasiliensis]QIS06695.1 Hsp70 family protein [Nocardia brasiliensis]